MAGSSKRSWTSFSLRTLLVAVTVVCVYLGWEVNIVRQRKAKLSEFQKTHYIEVTKAADYAARFPANAKPKDVASTYFLWRWLGDEPVQEIGYYPHIVKDADLAKMRDWFPEAKFVETRPMEPCHPGCFPWGTMIETAKGRRPVEQIQIGDQIVAISRTGEVQKIPVSSIFRTRNRLLEVQTTAGGLLTTPTQPLCVTNSKNIAAGELQCGEMILVWKDGKTTPVRVERTMLTERVEPVINLVLGDSEAFIANGFVARSKPPADSVLTESGASVSHHAH
jgi:hypothetical protein